MSESDLGLGEAVSMALGGMIGGGIYAVLGVVAGITGPATWFAFVVVFGGASYLAVRQRDQETVNPLPPLVGLVGTAGFLPLLFYHLYRAEPQTLGSVVVITVAVVAIELLYFERDVLEEEVVTIETQLGSGD